MTKMAAPHQILHLTLATIHVPTFAPPATLDRNEEALYRVVMPEANKAYLTKGVNADNQAGLFREYNHSGRPGGSTSHES